jgi:predicted amidophosphoribosyltransferase
MSLLAPTSRSQLGWYQFNQQEDGSWGLVLPPYYARLFAACYPSIIAKSNTGFRDSRTGKTRFAFFDTLDSGAQQRVQAFIGHYGRVVALGLNKYIDKVFSDELDPCLALDFNKPEPGRARTEIGELEYLAKYQQDAEAMAALASHAVQGLRMLPRRPFPRPRLLTYVPCEPEKDVYLPRTVAEAVVEELDESYWGVSRPLATPTLTVAKRSAKNLTVEQKIALWQEITEANGIKLSRKVEGHSVYVLDDLYQSGASLWSFAGYLKRLGARNVIGLVCVKSLRDKDNQ